MSSQPSHHHLRAEQFAIATPDVVEKWQGFGSWDRPYFPSLVGVVVEEVRTDYCRMRLPFRQDLEQPAGVVHGGAIATLIDTVVVPAIGQAYPVGTRYSTVDMHVQRLRTKLHPAGDLIETVRGFGYRLKAPGAREN